MARLSLAELRAQFENEKNKEETGGGDSGGWKDFYPFWKMEPNQMAVVRFLPDADQDNPTGFYVENLTHSLIVNGKKRVVPCLTMYGESCPCCEKSQHYYNVEKNEALGKKFWKKKEFLTSVKVQTSPFEFDNGTNLAKLAQIGPKIFNVIKTAIASGDIENDPDSFKGGYDFRIRKAKTGEFADYSTSNFSPKQTDISEEDISKITLFNLKDRRTKYMDRATMEALILASETGAQYNDDQGSGDAAPTGTGTSTPAGSSTPSTPSTPDVASQQPADASPAAGGKATSILEQIRARAAAQAAS